MAFSSGQVLLEVFVLQEEGVYKDKDGVRRCGSILQLEHSRLATEANLLALASRVCHVGFLVSL